MIALKAPAARLFVKLRTLTIKRSGQVNWKVIGDHHCGPKSKLRPDGTVPVRYTVEITCAPQLDQRGFLLDQAMLDAWVQRQATIETALSCEALVVALADALLAKVQRDTPHCDVRGLIVTLSPAPFQASITAAYER
jgi:hypothetical protein